MADESPRANAVRRPEIRMREGIEGERRLANSDLVHARQEAVEANRIQGTFLANMNHADHPR
jgi:hypothetical protein